MQHTIDTIRLQQVCEEKGFKGILDLANKSGVHRNTVSGLLSGKTSPFSSSFLKIAKTLNLKPRDLINSPKTFSFETQVKEAIEKSLKTSLDLAYFIFGSRATPNKARQFSDLDIGISGGLDKISTERFLTLKQEFAELFEDLPIKVDLVNFDQAPDWFLLELKQLPVYFCGDIKNYYYIHGYIDAKKAEG